MSNPLLDVRDLVKIFPGQTRRAVDGVSFTIRSGESLALVGESGSGKTTTGRCILRLIEPTDGVIRFDGQDLRAMDRDGLRRFRRQAQMVFQDPGESLTPWLTVGALIGEGLDVHRLAE